MRRKFSIPFSCTGKIERDDDDEHDVEEVPEGRGKSLEESAGEVRDEGFGRVEKRGERQAVREVVDDVFRPRERVVLEVIDDGRIRYIGREECREIVHLGDEERREEVEHAGERENRKHIEDDDAETRPMPKRFQNGTVDSTNDARTMDVSTMSIRSRKYQTRKKPSATREDADDGTGRYRNASH